jgi:hypothetical protein
MTGVWKLEGSWPLNFKRLTWQAKNPKPAPPTIFDGDWAGIGDEGGGLKIHIILHISNTEDGLMALLDCPEEKFEGALAQDFLRQEIAEDLDHYLAKCLRWEDDRGRQVSEHFNDRARI